MNNRSSPRNRRETPLPSVHKYGKNRGSKTPFNGCELCVRRLVLRVRSQPAKAIRLGIVVGGFVVFFVLLLAESWPSLLGGSSSRWEASPRYVTFYRDDERVLPTVRRLDLNVERYPSKRRVKVHQDSLDAQKRLKNSKEHRRGRAEEFETDDCKAQYDWQLTQHPTCNILYEYDLANLHADTEEDELVRLISFGYWRDIWMVRESLSGTKRALKTIRYTHDYVPRNYERHRRDAMAMERLTKSPFVVDIYGFCANSGIFEYSSEGDIESAIWDGHDDANLSKVEKLRIATQAAIGLAVAHNMDKEGQASVAHTDITPGQYILIDGWYKLNDFNRARFIRWSSTENKPCGYVVGRNPGTNRSPEEYMYEEQSEKVDVYSLGNILYMLLTALWPFEDMSDRDAMTEVKEGRRPPIAPEIWNSTDRVDVALKEAMVRCHLQDQFERATAREIEHYLKEKMNEIDPGTLEAWEKKYGHIMGI